MQNKNLASHLNPELGTTYPLFSRMGRGKKCHIRKRSTTAYYITIAVEADN